MPAWKRFRQHGGVVRTGIAVGLLVAFPFALYLSVTLGTLGASVAIQAVGVTLGVPIGVMGTIVVVGGAILASGGFAGGGLAWLLERVLRRGA